MTMMDAVDGEFFDFFILCEKKFRWIMYFFFSSRLKCLWEFTKFFFITASLAKREKVTGIKKKNVSKKIGKERKIFPKSSIAFLFS